MEPSSATQLPEISATKAVAVVAVAATVGFSVAGMTSGESATVSTPNAAPTPEQPIERAEAKLRKKLKPNRPAASQPGTPTD